MPRTSDGLVWYRIGNQDVLVTPDDKRRLDDDMTMYGNATVRLDRERTVVGDTTGERVDPATFRIAKSEDGRLPE